MSARHFTDDDVNSAIRHASDVLHSQFPQTSAPLRESSSIVSISASIIDEALVLQRAALELGLPGPQSDPQARFIDAAVCLQQELLSCGWRNVMEGHFSAASAPRREIDELGTFVLAARYDSDGPRRFAAGKKWSIARAWQTVTRELSSEGTQTTSVSQLEAAGRDVRDFLAKFNHTTLHLINHQATWADGEFQRDALNKRKLEILALAYAVAATKALSQTGKALAPLLTESGQLIDRYKAVQTRMLRFGAEMQSSTRISSD